MSSSSLRWLDAAGFFFVGGDLVGVIPFWYWKRVDGYPLRANGSYLTGTPSETIFKLIYFAVFFLNNPT